MPEHRLPRRAMLSGIGDASIDVNRITKDVDIESLQEILSSVTFCDITNEIDTRYVDNNLIKLFQLAQLLVEYLLVSSRFTNTKSVVYSDSTSLILLIQKEFPHIHA
ncbi:unnamed protein product [Schistosoma mattheei]|uniref:Uncharacterized protein n=1 Tax=Schistosoma mattheei TaxID=31246 RepID=A0A183P7Q9_9TREM|nr:unnamed protein product [Schistosoma mattheei]